MSEPKTGDPAKPDLTECPGCKSTGRVVDVWNGYILIAWFTACDGSPCFRFTVQSPDGVCVALPVRAVVASADWTVH